jgi:hypothetical protein
MTSDAPPTVRQVYALAAALCARDGEDLPRTRGEASALIEQLRVESGHPAPRLDRSAPPRWGARRRSGGPPGTEKLARAIAAEVARELR